MGDDYVKKNGFTLVELLAVIAILAILVIVAMPNVIDMFNQAKQNTFVTEVQKYMDNAKAQFTSDAFSNAGKTIYYSSEDNTSLSTSKLDIDGNKEYFIEMDRHGKFKRIVIYDANFCYDIYSPGGKGDITGTKSKKIDDDITKSTIGASDVWLSGSDSVSAIINGDNYVVSGCNGEAKAIVNQDSESEKSEMIEFSIYSTNGVEQYNTTLEAEAGMTWREWVESEYNTKEVYLNEAYMNGAIWFGVAGGLIDDRNNFVNPDSIIDPNAHYEIWNTTYGSPSFGTTRPNCPWV